MKAGIYIPGLGEAFVQQSTLNYATHFMHELDQNRSDAAERFSLKQEKESFGPEPGLETNVVSITRQNGAAEELVYRFYDFNYAAVLTRRFDRYNVLLKALFLFGLVLNKFPLTLYRLFFINRSQAYSGKFRLISVYAMFILLILALFGLSLVPASITVLSEFAKTEDAKSLISIDFDQSPLYSWLKTISLNLVAVSAVLYTIIPSARNFLSLLAAEFVSANQYLSYGLEAQSIHGQFDRLIEYIAEKEGPDCRIQIHAYSFGGVIAMDHVFPIGNTPSTRLKQMLETVITVGFPYDFINNYYPRFYAQRNTEMNMRFQWFNVYSASDALGTNFRGNNLAEEAEYGIAGIGHLPKNIRYELNNQNPYNPFHFLFLQSLKAHQCYWDDNPSGQSCLRKVLLELKAGQLL